MVSRLAMISYDIYDINGWAVIGVAIFHALCSIFSQSMERK